MPHFDTLKFNFLTCAAVILSSAAAAAPGENACTLALRQRAAEDLHCPPTDVHAWDEHDGTVDVVGCGLRASYALQEPCTWTAVSPPKIEPTLARNEVRLDLGVGAPSGLAGVAYERYVGDTFALEPSAGWGFSGAQLSLLVRMRNFPIIGSPGVGMSLAFGPGVGGLVGEKRGAILWLDVEIFGLEHRFEGGTVLSGGFGLVLPIEGTFSVCHSTCGPEQTQSFLYPALRVGMGRWF